MDSSIPKAIQTALEHHQAGRLHQAETIFKQILQVEPDHPDVLHFLGVIAFQGGKKDIAVEFISKAIRINPSALMHYNLGLVLRAQGKLDAAIESYRQALILKPDYAEAYNNIGNLLKEQRKLDEAIQHYRKALLIEPDDVRARNNLEAALKEQGKPDAGIERYRNEISTKPGYVEAHNNSGYTSKEQGKSDVAVERCHQASSVKPDDARAHNNRGNDLLAQGKFDAAVESYRKAISLKPDYAMAHYNLGNALQVIGQFDDAVLSYRRALEIKPDYTEAHCNLGTTFHDIGYLDEAEASYQRALKINPDFAEAHCNLGTTVNDLGRFDEAEASYRRALQINPDFADALNNLALLFNSQGKSAMALNTIQQSMQIKETEEAKSILVACIKHMQCTHDDNEIRVAVIRAFTETWCRPSDLVQVGTNLVKFNPDISGCIARSTKAWPLRLSAQDLFGTNGLVTVASDPLLCILLGSALIGDIEMERFLTMARSTMLEAASGMTASDGDVGATLIFYSALARQCFINEYVFTYTNDEIRKAGAVRDSLAAALEAKLKVPALWLVAVAAYFPLNSLTHAARLLDTQWPESVTALLVQQVCEPEEELQLRATIPRLTNIEDEVSLLVQSQYERNPYPRWVKAAPAGKAKHIIGYLRQKFPLASFTHHSKSDNPDILIAGCGTGQHSIGAAQQFLGAHVLAIDLSMSSLSYAKRKTRELGLTSMEYAQADILKLGSLGRSFDIIDSSGVLHHLADPWAGWQVLLSLLRPGGFMGLGFYSDVARRNIVKIRDFIAEQGYGDTANEIRQCRQDLIDLDKNTNFGGILKSSDFFSISTCRDLLFHVQEHRMTLTGIDAFLRKNNLIFIGFEIGADVLRAYKLRFPDDRAATNLGQWQIFENETPDTFIGMYQFWIQKTN